MYWLVRDMTNTIYTKLYACASRAAKALAVQAPPPILLDRYLELRTLAEFPLFNLSTESTTDRIKARARQLLLAPQADYNEVLLGYLRRQLLEQADRHENNAGKSLLYIAPFDVLSRNGGAARIIGLATALSVDRNVNIISVVGPRRQAEVIPVAPGVKIYAVPLTEDFEQSIFTDRKDLGDAAVCLGFGRELSRLPLLIYWYRKLAENACACILNQPYLIRLWQMCSPGLPLLYDVPEVNAFFTRRIAGSNANKERVDHEQRILESETISAAAMIGMASVQDMEAVSAELDESTRKRFTLIPNGISAHRAVFSPPGTALELQRAVGWSGHLAVFLGSPGYLPNIGAAKHIMTELAPRYPDCTFAIIGMTRSECNDIASPANGIFLGCVSEEQKISLLAMADLALAPIPGYDSGSSLKIAEYIAHGKPVIASPAGRRGYEGIGELLPSVAMENMAVVLGSLLALLEGDRIKLDNDSKQARLLLVEKYDWQAIALTYRNFIKGTH